MKNVLFATTALVGMGVAGSAFAEAHTGVALSGSAEMGVTYFDGPKDTNGDGIIAPGETGDTTVFHNDIDVTFTLSGATDNGSLTFGATVDLDEINDGDNEEFENSVFVSGDFGTLSMGDVDGAYDKAMSELPAGGLSDEADLASGTSGLDGVAGEILRYDYSFGDLTVSASLALEDQMPINDTGGATSLAALDDNVYGVGVEYGTDFGGASVTLGVGYQFTSTNTPAGPVGNGDHSVIGASLVVGFGDFEVIGKYESFDRPADATAVADNDIIGVGATYSTGALGFGIGYETSDAVDTIVQGYVTYDLTGGAELVAAAGYTDDGAGNETTQAGFGIGLSF